MFKERCRLQGSVEEEAVREMADWLKPCQHICVALATLYWTKADDWIQMLEKLWCACNMPILFREQVLSSMNLWNLNIQICLQIVCLL